MMATPPFAPIVYLLLIVCFAIALSSCLVPVALGHIILCTQSATSEMAKDPDGCFATHVVLRFNKPGPLAFIILLLKKFCSG